MYIIVRIEYVRHDRITFFYIHENTDQSNQIDF